MAGVWDGDGLVLLISALSRLKAVAPVCTTESLAWTKLIIASFFCGRWSGVCPNLRDKNLRTDGVPHGLNNSFFINSCKYLLSKFTKTNWRFPIACKFF